MNQAIYLDNNATTPMASEVVDAMAEAMRAGYANPTSQHDAGRQARRVIEAARERVVELLGGKTTGRQIDRLIFTSGGTEANNLALFGLAGASEANDPDATKPEKRLVLSPIEHPSISAVADELTRRGWLVDHLPVGVSGVVDAKSLETLLTPNTRFASVMLGNNETGALQPVAEMAETANNCGIPLHTDAVQAVGKIDVHFGQLGAAAMSLAAHKFHGPLGIGALLIRNDVQLRPRLFGGFQQAGLRPGTESLPLVIGMRTALELWHAERQVRQERLSTLRNRLEQHICAALPDAVVISQDAARLPHTSNIAFVSYDRQALFLALDMAGLACSTGSACASGSSEPSPVLIAMGCDKEQIRGSLRLSLGAETSADDVDEAARRMLLVCKQLQR